jgi:hypothetical protein
MWRVAWLAAFSLLTGAVVGVALDNRLLPWDGPRRLVAAALGALVCAVAGVLVAGDRTWG